VLWVLCVLCIVVLYLIALGFMVDVLFEVEKGLDVAIAAMMILCVIILIIFAIESQLVAIIFAPAVIIAIAIGVETLKDR